MIAGIMRSPGPRGGRAQVYPGSERVRAVSLRQAKPRRAYVTYVRVGAGVLVPCMHLVRA